MGLVLSLAPMLKWLFRLVALVAIVWFGAMVPLGRRTLFGHLWAIAHTQEAKELGEGAKEASGHLADKVRQEIAVDGGGAAPSEKLTEHDRKALRELVRQKGAQ